MLTLIYLAVGALPGFLLGGQTGILLELIIGLLLTVIDHLNKLIIEIRSLNKTLKRSARDNS